MGKQEENGEEKARGGGGGDDQYHMPRAGMACGRSRSGGAFRSQSAHWAGISSANSTVSAFSRHSTYKARRSRRRGMQAGAGAHSVAAVTREMRAASEGGGLGPAGRHEIKMRKKKWWECLAP